MEAGSCGEGPRWMVDWLRRSLASTLQCWPAGPMEAPSPTSSSEAQAPPEGPASLPAFPAPERHMKENRGLSQAWSSCLGRGL